MTFASLEFLATIVAAGSASMGRLDGLSVQKGGRGPGQSHLAGAGHARVPCLSPDAFAAFTACFADLDDPRADNTRHDLQEILLIAFCAVLCGAEEACDMALFGQSKQDYFCQFLRLPHGIPSHDTFSRLFRPLDPTRFPACFLAFLQRFAETRPDVIALDGKTLRRSFDHAAAQSPLPLVSAWAADQRLVLGPVTADDKSHEITAVPKLLALLSRKGTIVTADARHRQRATAAQIVEPPGEYVLALKANQGTLYDDVRHGWTTHPRCRPPGTLRSTKSMAGWRPAPAWSRQRSPGGKNSTTGRDWRPSAKSHVRARSAARSRPRRPTMY
jgi:hypothetical protein